MTTWLPHPPSVPSTPSIPPALEPPPLSSPSICGIPGFPFVLLIYPEPGGAGSAAPLAPARRAGTKPGLLPEKWDESKSPQKGNCQGNPEPPWCLTFICCLFFLFFPVYSQRDLPPLPPQRLVGWGWKALCGNPSRHVWRQGCQLDLAFRSVWGHVEVSAATQTSAHV